MPQCGANICHLANGSFRINDVSVFESKQKCHETFLCAKLCLSVLSILVAFFLPIMKLFLHFGPIGIEL